MNRIRRQHGLKGELWLEKGIRISPEYDGFYKIGQEKSDKYVHSHSLLSKYNK